MKINFTHPNVYGPVVVISIILLVCGLIYGLGALITANQQRWADINANNIRLVRQFDNYIEHVRTTCRENHGEQYCNEVARLRRNCTTSSEFCDNMVALYIRKEN